MEQDLKPLTMQVGALWRQLRETLVPSRLDRFLGELERAHRRLVQRDQALPCTSRAGRFRRRAIEDLQSQTRALEVQLRQAEARAAELEALLQCHVGEVEALLRGAPALVTSTLGSEGPYYPLVLVGLTLIPGCLQWPMSICAGCCVAFSLLAPLSRRISFDGRSLQKRWRWFGLRLWCSTYDLTRFNDVVLLDFEQTNENVGTTWKTRLLLRSGDDSLVLGTWPRGTLEARERADELRTWCIIAARDAA